jgi:hypothetical protein
MLLLGAWRATQLRDLTFRIFELVERVEKVFPRATGWPYACPLKSPLQTRPALHGCRLSLAATTTQGLGLYFGFNRAACLGVKQFSVFESTTAGTFNGVHICAGTQVQALQRT